MGRTKKMEVRCEHCGKWFGSPIMFGDSDTFDSATLIGNRAQCPRCRQMTGMNKENIRAAFDDGGFSGNKT